jgi:hypothetical protein
VHGLKRPQQVDDQPQADAHREGQLARARAGLQGAQRQRLDVLVGDGQRTLLEHLDHGQEQLVAQAHCGVGGSDDALERVHGRSTGERNIAQQKWLAGRPAALVERDPKVAQGALCHPVHEPQGVGG